MLRRFVFSSTRHLSVLKNIAAFPIFRPLQLQHFSTIKNTNSDDVIEKAKKEGKQFYNSQVQKVIEIFNPQQFQKIISSSQDALIIDLYADWCEPCKLLTPRLEKKVNSVENARLLKINIDKLPQIAHAFKIKSVPVVFLIYKGQAVDMITGNVSDQDLNKFFNNIKKITGGNPELEQAIKQLDIARGLIGEKKQLQAAQVLQKFAFKKINQQYLVLRQLLLAKCYLSLEKAAKLKDAISRASNYEKILSQIPDLQQFYQVLKSELQKMEAEQKQDPKIRELESKIKNSLTKEERLESKYHLAVYLKQKSLIENGLQIFMEIIKEDKNWSDKKASKYVLSIFKQLGNNSPIVQKYRKIMQRLLS